MHVLERRAWVVNLALVCREAYRSVKGVLYERMVITSHNFVRVHSMSLDASCLHIFHAVRHLTITSDISGFDNPIMDHAYSLEDASHWEATRLARRFPSVVDLDVPGSFFQVLAASTCPCRLAVRFRKLDFVVSKVARFGALKNVTHLVGCIPLSFTYHPGELRRTVREILESGPALTHVAFDLTRARLGDVSAHITFWTIIRAHLEELLRAALEHRRLEVVALAVNGENAVRDSEFITEVVCRVNDPRVRVWLDQRPIKTRLDEEQVTLEDAWAGRDVWTEAKPIRSR